MSRILVFAEISDGAVHDVALQALAKARSLAGSNSVTAIAAGQNISAAAQSLFAAGADVVSAIDNAALKDYLPGPYLAAVDAAIGADPFSILILPATTTGNDLAPLLAAKRNAACVLDASNLKAEGAGFVSVRIEYDRKVESLKAAAKGQSLVVTVKDGIANPVSDAARNGAVQNVPFAPPASRSRVVKRDVAAKSVNLRSARVIVGAGAGLGSKDNFGRVRELADAIGGQIGATRAVVDAGWLPADHQIGQTGATVRPDLYIACGVSGAVQHWVGISEARTIIAINTDKAAPIMRHAHYRIIGDVNAVLPKLVKVLKG